MHEINPMLGLRGVRLSIVYPEIVAMQVRAILEGAAAVIKAGGKAVPEIMIPLVGHVNELTTIKKDLEETAKAVESEQGVEIPYSFGTMIEVPRGALTADEIAKEAEFFSFGTNDLTQMTFGFSRDDSDKFLKPYVERKILPGDPFESIDRKGVGQLMQIAIDKAKTVRPNIKLGICGEHGGDPELGGVLPRDRPELRVLLALPRAHRPPRGGAGGARQGRLGQVTSPLGAPSQHSAKRPRSSARMTGASFRTQCNSPEAERCRVSFVQAVPELLSEPVERWAEYYFGPPASPDTPSWGPYEERFGLPLRDRKRGEPRRGRTCGDRTSALCRAARAIRRVDAPATRRRN